MDYEEAYKSFSEIIKKDRKNGAAYYNKAYIQSLKNNKLKAIKLLKIAISFDKKLRDMAKNEVVFKNFLDQ